MMRLASKLGFSLEACSRRVRTVRGAVYDGLEYGVLRLGWRARYPDEFSQTPPLPLESQGLL